MKRKVYKKKVYRSDVSPPELSKELKDLGMQQDGALYYWKTAGKQWVLYPREVGRKRLNDYVAALTATQLSEALKEFGYPQYRAGNFYCKNFYDDGEDINLETNKEIEARTKMLIILIKTKKLTIFKHIFAHFSE